ncbi:MAG: protein jag [Clostridia bacterium]|nr:protein jag [Clostridia bacterium]
MEEKNVFTAKSVDEALDEGLKTLGLTLDEVDYEIVEEGKKGLFGLGSVKAKVKIIPKRAGGVNTTEFIDGLLAIIGIKAVSEVVSDGESLNIDIKTSSSARVIGKRGDVLDAIQCLAGAVENIGREEYRKVVVDCENYRAQREQTLKDLANKLAKTAVETGRKMLLEPMSPYERRVIHAALMDNAEVKTASEGREPARYVVVIPNNAKPYDRGVRYGERRRDGRRDNRRDGRGDRGGRRGDRRERGERTGGREERAGGRPSGGAKRGKKEIYFGTFLGNSNDLKKDEPEKKEEE